METQICQKCGKKMIKVSTGQVLTSYPPQYPQQWWCGCGNTEKAETIREKTIEEVNKETWKQINI